MDSPEDDKEESSSTLKPREKCGFSASPEKKRTTNRHWLNSWSVCPKRLWHEGLAKMAAKRLPIHDPRMDYRAQACVLTMSESQLVMPRSGETRQQFAVLAWILKK